MTLLLEQLQRERHVVGGQRAAIVKPGTGAHQEAIGQAVVRDLNGPRSEAIERVGLVLRARHQGRECRFDSGSSITFQDEAVQRIEGNGVLVVDDRRRDLRKHAALRGGRVDIVELLEIRRVLEVPERRDPVPLGLFSGGGSWRECARQCCRAQPQRIPPVQVKSISHWAFHRSGVDDV